jgi:hypothetical protein
MNSRKIPIWWLAGILQWYSANHVNFAISFSVYGSLKEYTLYDKLFYNLRQDATIAILWNDMLCYDTRSYAMLWYDVLRLLYVDCLVSICWWSKPPHHVKVNPFGEEKRDGQSLQSRPGARVTWWEKTEMVNRSRHFVFGISNTRITTKWANRFCVIY